MYTTRRVIESTVCKSNQEKNHAAAYDGKTNIWANKHGGPA